MTTIEKIKAEIANLTCDCINGMVNQYAVLQIIDKYAEQEPCEDCDYSEIIDWEQDAKTGKAKPIYWCERHKEPCDDAVSIESVIEWLKAKDIIKMSTQEETARKELKELPPARPQEQTGHWIRQDNTKEPLYGWYFCSECNSVIGDKTKFCSNCGAKMIKSQESEEISDRNMKMWEEIFKAESEDKE